MKEQVTPLRIKVKRINAGLFIASRLSGEHAYGNSREAAKRILRYDLKQSALALAKGKV